MFVHTDATGWPMRGVAEFADAYYIADAEGSARAAIDIATADPADALRALLNYFANGSQWSGSYDRGRAGEFAVLTNLAAYRSGIDPRVLRDTIAASGRVPQRTAKRPEWVNSVMDQLGT
jgi:hypothetical protein